MTDAKDKLEVVSLGQLAITWLLGASMSQVWSAANILQIVAFMIVSKVKFPSNSMSFFGIILDFVTFDVVPEDMYQELQESVLNDLPGDMVYHEQVAQAGFETGYIFVSMFLTFIWLILFLVQLVFNFVMSHLLKLCKSSEFFKNRQRIYRDRVKQVWTELFRLMIELCLDISICASIELIMRQVGTKQEQASYFTSMTLFLFLVFGIFYSIYTLKTEKQKIENPEVYVKFNRQHAGIWMDNVIDYNSLIPCFNIFFVIRRILFTCILI